MKYKKLLPFVFIAISLANLVALAFIYDWMRGEVKHLNERITVVGEAHQDLLEKTQLFSQDYEEVKVLLASGIVENYEQLQESLQQDYEINSQIVNILEGLNNRVTYIENALW